MIGALKKIGQGSVREPLQVFDVVRLFRFVKYEKGFHFQISPHFFAVYPYGKVGSMTQFVPYILICLTTMACWITSQKIFLLIFCILTLGTGLLTRQIDLMGLILTLILAFLVHLVSKNLKIKFFNSITSFLFLLLSYFLFAHIAPGFYNIRFFDAVKFSENSAPFTMYLNFDKPFIGIFLLIFFGFKKVSNLSEIIQVLKTIAPIILTLISLIIPLALVVGYIEFDLKIPNLAWIWIINNLLIVCVAEECLFRGFIQKKLKLSFSKTKYGVIFSIAISSILFGLAHYKGGMSYIGLSTLAGAFYGYSYEKTDFIEAPILTHFLLNLAHFLFFSYPAAKSRPNSDSQIKA